MLGGKRDDGSSGITILGEDSHIVGNLKDKCMITIHGYFEGELETTNLVTIGKAGKVKGTVKAREIVIGGTVEGNLIITGRVEMQPGSKLIGDLETVPGYLIIHEGAIIEGQIKMPSPTKTKPTIKTGIKTDKK